VAGGEPPCDRDTDDAVQQVDDVVQDADLEDAEEFGVRLMSGEGHVVEV